MMRRRRGMGQVILVRQNGGFLGTLINICVALVLIMILALILFNCLGGGSIVTKIDKTVPSAEKALFKIFTVSGTYYAETARMLENGDVVMENWYSRLDGQWVSREGEFTLPFAIFGEMKISRRS